MTPLGKRRLAATMPVGSLLIAAALITWLTGCTDDGDGSSGGLPTDPGTSQVDPIRNADDLPGVSTGECTPRREVEGDDVYTMQGALGPIADPASMSFALLTADEAVGSLDTSPAVSARFGVGLTIEDPDLRQTIFLPEDSFMAAERIIGEGEADLFVAYMSPPAETPGDPGFATMIAVSGEDGAAVILNRLCPDPLHEVLARVAEQTGRHSTWSVLTALAARDEEVLAMLED